MQIANIKFPPFPLFLAPMEDVTDPAFRLLCKRFGADMVTTEFVSADALVRNVNRTTQKLTIHEEERPVAIQIYGREPAVMADAAQICEQAHPDIIDLNFGCPVKKVAGKGAGAGLLCNVPKMLEITRAVVQAVKIPVTVKTRLGWDEQSKNIVALAEQLQDCGIAALTVHGRTRAQMYKGEADWTLIKAVKDNPRMTIPIIGNGDIRTPEEARNAFERYGVDAVMVGRAAVGQPWIFGEMKQAAPLNPPKEGKLGGVQNTENIDFSDNFPPSEGLRGANPLGGIGGALSFEEKKNILKEYILASIKWLDGIDTHSLIDNCQLSIVNCQRFKGIIHSRRHLAATPIFKGIPNFRETRIAMLRAETLAELFEIIDGIEVE